ncbi:hypothetical protein SprV_0100325000 [Sparganum proliferum]
MKPRSSLALANTNNFSDIANDDVCQWPVHWATAQAVQPRQFGGYDPKKYKEPFQGINECAYVEVEEGNGKKTLAWTCGLPAEEKSGRVKYDCCPGFKRSDIIDNKCVEVDRTYVPIVPTLEFMDKNQTASALESIEPDLAEDGKNKDFTVFVPDEDGSLPNSSPDAIKSIIADGRQYARNFKDGTNIPVRHGPPLKVSAYPNNLVFIECQLLRKPDLETSNGLIHFTSGPVESPAKYPTVLKRLQAEPDVRDFVSSIPSDLRRELDSPNSQQRFTVFAPDNAAWNNAKSKASSPEAVERLVRGHVLDNMVCGKSIDPEKRTIGRTKNKNYLSAVQKPDGSRVVLDTCGSEVPMREADKMAGNGVVHVMRQALWGTEALNLQEALQCLAKDPNSDLSQAARAMSRCNINVRPQENAVVLLPNDQAVQSIGGMDPCSVYSHHVLTSSFCKMKHENGVGVPQECLFQSKYTAPNGDKPIVTNQYVRERDGSKLHFGKATTTGMKPIEFRDGIIYPVKSINPPPTERVMDMIAKDPDLKTTYENMQKSGFASVLQQKKPNYAFLAPQNHGWVTRHKENAYSPSQMRKLMELHTIPHQMLTGKNGNIGPETIQVVDSLNGRKLKIKKTYDGSTFVGHDNMNPEEWSLAIGEPQIGTDGVYWKVDWPMVCPDC